MKKDIEEVWDLCQSLANQATYYTHERRLKPKKATGLLELDDASFIKAQLTFIAN